MKKLLLFLDCIFFGELFCVNQVIAELPLTFHVNELNLKDWNIVMLFVKKVFQDNQHDPQLNQLKEEITRYIINKDIDNLYQNLINYVEKREKISRQ